MPIQWGEGRKEAEGRGGKGSGTRGEIRKRDMHQLELNLIPTHYTPYIQSRATTTMPIHIMYLTLQYYICVQNSIVYCNLQLEIIVSY